jgi:cobalt-zinc-cadmium efflux system protein
MPAGHPGDRFLDSIAHELEHDFGIEHTTLQIEIGDGDECRLEPDGVP